MNDAAKAVAAFVLFLAILQGIIAGLYLTSRNAKLSKDTWYDDVDTNATWIMSEVTIPHVFS